MFLATNGKPRSTFIKPLVNVLLGKYTLDVRGINPKTFSVYLFGFVRCDREGKWVVGPSTPFLWETGSLDRLNLHRLMVTLLETKYDRKSLEGVQLAKGMNLKV